MMVRTQILLLFIAIGVLSGPLFGQSETSFIDPYEGVDWASVGRYRASMHNHTTRSDGSYTPAQLIDDVHSRGFKILTITDHDTMTTSQTTWPWTSYGRDPELLGMIAIQGNEPSNTHHMGSYFNDYGDGSQSNTEQAIIEIGNRNGLAVMFHPGRYSWTTQQYVNLYNKYDHLVGMEVYNQGDRYPGDRQTWDNVLTQLMPSRPVWGYANDDAHSPSHVARNWNMFLLEELTSENVRQAMEAGHFYFSHCPNNGQDLPVPVIHSISLNQDKDIITIDASGYVQIYWISQGVQVGTGNTFNATSLPAGANYVRARLIGPAGQGYTYTQPFGVIQILPPLTWAVEPYESGPGEVTMVANTDGLDAYSNVEYYFECVSDATRSSGWQSSPTYVDAKAPPAPSISSYRVKVRIGGDTEADWSDEVAVQMTFGLLAHWPLEGGNIQSVVEGSPVTFSGGPELTVVPGVPGVSETALRSYGSSYLYTDKNNVAYFDSMHSALTVSMWMKSDTPTSTQWEGFVSRNGSTGYGWAWRKYQSGPQLHFAMRGTSGNDDDPPTGVALYDGQWNHVAATWDGAVKRLYVNGELQTFQADTGTISPTTASVVLFGQMVENGNLQRLTNTALSHVKLYNYALTSDQIAHQYRGWICDPDLPALRADLTGDCRVGLEDLAILASEWLKNNRIPAP